MFDKSKRSVEGGMLSRIAGRMILMVLMLIQIVLGLSQSEGAPQAAPHSEINDPTSAREWYEKGDAAERAGNKQEALRDYQLSAKAYRRRISRDLTTLACGKDSDLCVGSLAGRKRHSLLTGKPLA